MKTTYIALVLAALSSVSALAGPSHCRGLSETDCATAVACKWVAKREPAFGVSARKAYCRLDIGAASKALKEQQDRNKAKGQ